MRTQAPRSRGESLVLDPLTRAAAPGQFVELPDGFVHYEIAGPAYAQPVVLVHGFSVPYYIWDPTFMPLAEAGFRVVRYDLFGRGFSDRPDVRYDRDLFDRQLLDLLTALGLDRPVDLVGLSMGGAICVVFADRHPTGVRKLCLIDPAGLPQRRPLYAKLIQAPAIGEWAMTLLGDRMLASNLKDDFHDASKFPEYAERYLVQMQYTGFKHALLSTLRSDLLTGAEEAYGEVGKQERPILLIWGREDRSIPLENSRKVKELMPRAELHIIDEAGHVCHYERPALVNRLIVDFLAR